MLIQVLDDDYEFGSKLGWPDFENEKPGHFMPQP